MLISINNKDVEIKGVSCEMNGEEGVEYTEPYINMYVSLTQECNTNCPFCAFRGEKAKFDFERFKHCLYKVNETLPINRLSFTGGEPTLELDILMKCLEEVKKMDNRIFTVVSTNGTHLKELDNTKLIDTVSLSRHAINDRENREIFRSDLVPSLSDIEKFNNINKMHLTCNIIKGYVDSQDKIFDYLDSVGHMGIIDAGFVSLMKVNDYSREHSIDFDSLNLQYSERFIKNKEFRYIQSGRCVCKCRNYLYFTKSKNVMAAYSRFAVDRDCNDGSFVFIKNQLRKGFTGEVLI